MKARGCDGYDALVRLASRGGVAHALSVRGAASLESIVDGLSRTPDPGARHVA